MKNTIIIGAGLTGLLLARELTRAGCKVTVVERGEPGREASWAGGGILSPLHPWRYSEPVTALAGWSQHHYVELIAGVRAESGIDPEFTQSGLLVLSDKDGEQAEQWAHHHDIQLQRVSAIDAASIEPRLGCVSGGVWMPHIAQVRNPRLVQALLKACVGLGVSVRSHCPCEQLIYRDSQILGIRTPEGDLFADSVVVAGGAWSRQILAGFGENLNVGPVKGQMLQYKTEPGFLQRIVLAEGHYLIPRRDGLILAGSTLEYAGFDKKLTQVARTQLSRAAEALVPALAEMPVVNHWAGLRPGSPTGVPYIGAHPELENLFVSVGHFRNGVAIGPASARLLADLMLDRTPILDPSAYRIVYSADTVLT